METKQVIEKEEVLEILKMKILVKKLSKIY